jgi:hypothetical protein
MEKNFGEAATAFRPYRLAKFNIARPTPGTELQFDRVQSINLNIQFVETLPVSASLQSIRSAVAISSLSGVIVSKTVFLNVQANVKRHTIRAETCTA